MIARLAAIAATACILGACDLEEAERLDLTRGSSRSIAPRFDGILLDGSTDLPLTAVIATTWDPPRTQRWSLGWTDQGLETASSQAWRIVGELEGSVVFTVEGVGPYANTIASRSLQDWIDRSAEVRLRVDAIPSINGAESSQRIRDDRATIEREFSFTEGSVLKLGDTIRVAVRNPGLNPIAIYSDYSGARQIGAYDLLVPPGGRDTLRWLVTGSPSGDAWIDFGWGDWGSHERRSFRVP